ncbi:MAG TPA: hypothetical protein VLY21_04625 [Nitrososphaerales archaeon]|nr:hypothetical protein [Nitrososphaerales archaeon]
MSKPVMYDKSKWDVSRGLDYSGGSEISLGQPYVHHDYPPLHKNTKLISQYDLEGRGDTSEIAKKDHYLYVCHMYSGGLSVVDVKDPARPQVVSFIPTDGPHAWSIKCRVVGNTLLVANDWKFFEPTKYHVHPEYPDFHKRGPREPVQSGIKIYDITKPAEPKLLSFFKTGQWTLEGGGNYCHRFWFDGHYAFISADMPGYWGGIEVIADVSDPKNPKEVSRFWRKGQWIEGGETPNWPNTFPGVQSHHAIVQGDRLYMCWFQLGATIVDISNIRKPTLVSEFNLDSNMNHTLMPIKNRQFAIYVSEYRFAYVVDISDERSPRVVGMFPRPPLEVRDRGVSAPFGPGIHNMHENPPTEEALKSDDRIYATAGCGGLRIYDVSDPYRISEVGYYVPGTPKVYYNPYGAEGGHIGAGIDVMDVFVDKKGLIYTSSYNGGLEILEFTG